MGRAPFVHVHADAGMTFENRPRGAAVIEVEVDAATGMIDVERVWIALALVVFGVVASVVFAALGM